VAQQRKRSDSSPRSLSWAEPGAGTSLCARAALAFRAAAVLDPRVCGLIFTFFPTLMWVLPFQKPPTPKSASQSLSSLFGAAPGLYKPMPYILPPPFQALTIGYLE
jgi:hypothetical protein